MEANKIEVKIFLLSLATLVLIEITAPLFISGIRISPMVLTGAIRLTEMTLIMLIVFFWGQGLPSIGLAPSKMVKGLLRGLFWSAGFGIITFFVFIALFLVDINPLLLIHTRLPAKSMEIVLFFLVAGIIGPVAEEILFRGIIYGFFRRWGVLAATCGREEHSTLRSSQMPGKLRNNAP